MRRISVAQGVWAVIVIGGHAALVPHVKDGPRGLELALIAGYGLLLLAIGRASELRPRSALEVWLRIGLATVETALSVSALTYGVVLQVSPIHRVEGHPTMPVSQAALALLAFAIAGLATPVLLIRARDRAILATRLVLAGCAIATAVSLITR